MITLLAICAAGSLITAACALYLTLRLRGVDVHRAFDELTAVYRRRRRAKDIHGVL